MLTASKELNEKLAAAVLGKEELEAHARTVEDQLAVTEQRHQQVLTDLEKQHDEQLAGLKKHYEQQLADLEVQHEHRVAEVETRCEGEVTKLKKVHDQLTVEIGQLQQETSTQLDQLKAENEALEMELNICRKNTNTAGSDIEKEDKPELTRLNAEKSHIEKQLKALEDQLRKLEMEKSTMIRTHKELRESLEQEVAGLQTKLEEADRKCDELVRRERDSMQREHALVVAALQEKLVEKNEKDRLELAASSQVCYCPVSCLALFHLKRLSLHSACFSVWLMTIIYYLSLFLQFCCSNVFLVSLLTE